MNVVPTRTRRGATDKPVVRLNMHISAPAYQRLMVNSTMEGKGPALLLEELIEEHLKAWQMPARGSANPARAPRRKSDPASPAEGSDRQNSGAESSPETAAA